MKLRKSHPFYTKSIITDGLLFLISLCKAFGYYCYFSFLFFLCGLGGGPEVVGNYVNMRVAPQVK